jgi:hypothetical protein
VADLTGGAGASVVLDFVAEQGAEMDGWEMTAAGGSYFVIGYGGELRIPTLDIISTERNIIGNIVATYNDLAELMALAQAGRVTLHTRTYPLDAAADALADLDAGRVRGRAILIPLFSPGDAPPVTPRMGGAPAPHTPWRGPCPRLDLGGSLHGEGTAFRRRRARAAAGRCRPACRSG